MFAFGLIVNTVPLIEACEAGEAALMVNEFVPSVKSITWMFPVPKAMFSSKVSIILLLVEISVAPSVGMLEVKVGGVASPLTTKELYNPLFEPIIPPVDITVITTRLTAPKIVELKSILSNIVSTPVVTGLTRTLPVDVAPMKPSTLRETPSFSISKKLKPSKENKELSAVDIMIPVLSGTLNPSGKLDIPTALYKRSSETKKISEPISVLDISKTVPTISIEPSSPSMISGPKFVLIVPGGCKNVIV
jgi:hypothetical protein